MRTFHPKEALVHMEEGAMLAEEGLFHPEEPPLLIRMAMMLPKEGAFLPREGPIHSKEGPIHIEDGAMLIEEGMFHPDQPSFLLMNGTMLLYERLVLPEEGSAHSVCRSDAVLGVRGATWLCRKPLLYRRSLRRPGTAALRTHAAEELLYQELTWTEFQPPYRPLQTCRSWRYKPNVRMRRKFVKNFTKRLPRQQSPCLISLLR